MNTYTAGLQLHTDNPEFPIQIIAKNSDDAWEKAVEIYRLNNNFSEVEVTQLVIFNEKKIS